MRGSGSTVEVIPEELRHWLHLQACLGILGGLGEVSGEDGPQTLADEEYE